MEVTNPGEGMRKLFVGGLSRHTTEETFRQYFEKFGNISDIVVMLDRERRESRGFGFVTYDSIEPVEEILQIGKHTIDGRSVEVKRAMPKEITSSTVYIRTKRIFIGGLSPETTEEDIKKYYEENFAKYVEVETVEVKRRPGSNESRCFGFINCKSEDSVDSLIILDPKPTKLGKNVQISKAQPRGGVPAKDLPPSRSRRTRDSEPHSYHSESSRRRPYSPPYRRDNQDRYNDRYESHRYPSYDHQSRSNGSSYRGAPSPRSPRPYHFRSGPPHPSHNDDYYPPSDKYPPHGSQYAPPSNSQYLYTSGNSGYDRGYYPPGPPPPPNSGNYDDHGRQNTGEYGSYY